MFYKDAAPTALRLEFCRSTKVGRVSLLHAARLNTNHGAQRTDAPYHVPNFALLAAPEA